MEHESGLGVPTRVGFFMRRFVRSSPRGISHQSSHCEALARFRRSDLAPAEETSASNDRVDQSEVTPACPSWIVGGEENAASTEEGRSGFYRGYADGRCRDYRR